jgi:hypothetical protein
MLLLARARWPQPIVLLRWSTGRIDPERCEMQFLPVHEKNASYWLNRDSIQTLLAIILPDIVEATHLYIAQRNISSSQTSNTYHFQICACVVAGSISAFTNSMYQRWGIATLAKRFHFVFWACSVLRVWGQNPRIWSLALPPAAVEVYGTLCQFWDSRFVLAVTSSLKYNDISLLNIQYKRHQAQNAMTTVHLLADLAMSHFYYVCKQDTSSSSFHFVFKQYFFLRSCKFDFCFTNSMYTRNFFQLL